MFQAYTVTIFYRLVRIFPLCIDREDLLYTKLLFITLFRQRACGFVRAEEGNQTLCVIDNVYYFPSDGNSVSWSNDFVFLDTSNLFYRNEVIRTFSYIVIFKQPTSTCAQSAIVKVAYEPFVVRFIHIQRRESDPITWIIIMSDLVHTR